MSEQDKLQKEHKALDEELLRQRIDQDENFHAAQLIKQKKTAMEAKEFQQFHKAQMVCTIGMCMYYRDVYVL